MTDVVAARRPALAVRMVAGLVAGAVIGVILTAVLLWVASGLRPLPVTYGRTAMGVLGLIVAPLTFAAVGWVLATRVSTNPTGWMFLLVAAAIGLMLPVNLLVGSATESLRPAEPAIVLIAWFRTVFSVPITLIVLTIAALIFPSGRLLAGRRWRHAVRLSILAGACFALSTALDPRGLYSYPALPSPTSLPMSAEPVVAALRVAAVALQIPAILLAVMAVRHRYRHGGEGVRAQLRWILFGVSIAGIGVMPYLVARFLIRVPNDLGEFVSAVAQLGACAFPITAAFAISRYRLFDVDLLIGRTLVYVPLSAICGGLYSAGIALFQRLFVAVTGETSDAAVVLAVLVVATAFTPLRRWMEALVEHRFPALEASTAAVAGRAGDASPDRAAPPRVTRRRSRNRAGTPAATGPAVGGQAAPTALVPRLLAVDGESIVDCPLVGRRSANDCLGCGYLVGVVREPQTTVICRATA